MVAPLTDDASGLDLLGVSLGCISLCLVLLAMWHYHSHAVEQRNNFNAVTVGCRGSFTFG